MKLVMYEFVMHVNVYNQFWMMGSIEFISILFCVCEMYGVLL
jgi:hypothetical protein